MLRLDVCIERLGIILSWISNTQDIDIETECQYFYLGVLDIQNPNKILKLNAKYCLDGKSDELQSYKLSSLYCVMYCMKDMKYTERP
jgi:hypothetical protein